MKFQRETATPEFCEELKPLLSKHYLEIAHYQDIPLDPAFDQYCALEKAGALRVFTCRDETSRLIGYCIFFVKHNLHYQGSLQAVQDILFIDPEFRNAGFGARFIDFCDSQLRSEGVQVSYHHVKKAHNFGPLLEKLGYLEVDLIFGRRLDK